MDTRAARRAAEKAARDLITSRAALVGDLGALQAERTRLADDVTTSRARGQRLVTQAEAQAAQLVAAARDLAADGEQRYADAYSAATAAGWANADLTALGYHPALPGSRDRRRQPDTPAQHNSAPAADASAPVPRRKQSDHSPGDAPPPLEQPVAI